MFVRPTEYHNDAGDPVVEVREFEDQFATAFASDTSCRGIKLVRFESPEDSTRQQVSEMSQAHWSLAIDFDVGRTEQVWKMNHTPNSKNEYSYGWTTGKGTPSAMAHTVYQA